ncbi:hypothetical protein [uncultured Thiocystis sp.]|uniref:hypothetical protein n=1 Tax=uncultured Thiocystis sp. TaxID=1202134 RepID=UPI0025E4FC24|nr:hypothetical protein [uncultured Thiocystis sp.]
MNRPPSASCAETQPARRFPRTLTLQGGLAPGLLMRVTLLAGVWLLPLGEFCRTRYLSPTAVGFTPVGMARSPPIGA